MTNRRQLLRSRAIAILCGLALPFGDTIAQTSASEENQNIEEVVVTGSRIGRTAQDQPVPVAVIGADAIAQSGFSNPSDILLRTPQVGVGTGSANGGLDDYGADAGATFINLRGLGTNRTLVLVDGLRRVSGTGASSAVDLATIPANMIERIEIITGGAAAVYGADAVTGVVNVILKHHADGFEVTARPGISGHGDDRTVSLSALYGKPLQDRGEFSVGLSYNQEDPLATTRRSFASINSCPGPNPNVSAANPYTNIAYTGCRFPNTSYGGAFTIGGTRYTIDASGALRPTQNGSLPFPWLGVGGGDGYNGGDFGVLRSGSKILSTLAHFGYEIGGGVKFTADMQFSNSKTSVDLQPLFEYANPINRDNPFVPASVAALMDQNGLTQLFVGRTDWDQGRNVRESNRNTYTVVSKLDGDLGASFKWTAFYQYGAYENSSTFTNERIASRYNQALDAVAGPAGPVCADPAAVAAGCQPLDIFGPNAASAGALAYFHYNAVTGTTNTQQVIGAQLTGRLLSLPAGPLSMSSGIEYRKESQDIHQDGLGQQGLLFFTYGPSAAADFSVKEAFVELLAPILKDEPFAKALEFEAAARYSDYDTIGHTLAWKTSVQWAPNSDLRFRVTRSSSVRAPNLTELFNPGTTSFSFYYDPCDYLHIGLAANRAANCAALGVPANYIDPLAQEGRIANTQGNAGLKAETSKSWTAGVVVTPGFTPSLSVALDWWSIDIIDAVNTLPVQDIINGCVDGPTLDPTLCPLVTRGNSRYGGGTTDPHAITVTTLTPLNVGLLKAEGVDVGATYGMNIGTGLFHVANRLKFSLNGSYTMKNDTLVNRDNPQNVIRIAGNSEMPKLRLNLTPEFDAGPLTVDWTVRYLSSSKTNVNYAPLFYNDNDVASRTYNDVYASFVVKSGIKLAAGINNVFDVVPPSNPEASWGTGKFGALFDNVGRYIFVQATARF